MNKAILFVFTGVTIVGATLLLGCVEAISPHDLTKTRIVVAEQRIRLFWQKNGKSPSTLAELPLLPGRDNKTTDAWGKELSYKVEGNKVTLSSPGKPGVMVPTASERGVTNTFDVTQPPGTSR